MFSKIHEWHYKKRLELLEAALKHQTSLASMLRQFPIDRPSSRTCHGRNQQSSRLISSLNPTLAQLRPQMLAIYLLINSLGTFLQLRGQATIISHDSFIIALDKHK